MSGAAPRRVLLLDAFSGGSHAAWSQGWAAHSRHRVDILTMEPTAWRWRMRGAAQTMARRSEVWVAEHGRPDMVVATDMIDLAAYLGFTRRLLGDVPAAVYLHENQLTYPRRRGDALDVGLAWTTWRTIAAADAVWCNSRTHRDQLWEALTRFVVDVPDHPHDAELAAVEARLAVIPVGVDVASVRARAARSGSVRPAGPPRVVCNQRWHPDKHVDAVLRALTRAARSGREFTVAVLGDDRGADPDRFEPLLAVLGDRVRARGHQPRDRYLEVLVEADIVVSAAANENFGIAMVEAVAAGARPVAPNRAAYPEVLDPERHGVTLYPEGGLGAALRAALADVEAGRTVAPSLAESMARFDWPVVAAQLDDAVDRLGDAGSPDPAAGDR